ncbi:hypothetical protein BPC006_II0156 [Burkholderia pseudomallei BPC006]|nr:hypothetical protein BPC006_II0156 [Burkholderia pseudomallei BPC006]
MEQAGQYSGMVVRDDDLDGKNSHLGCKSHG